MHRRNAPDASEVSPEAIDTDSDRYPDFKGVLRQLLNDPNIPEGPVERIEVTCLASGEATYRVWPSRALEHVGGYIPDARTA